MAKGTPLFRDPQSGEPITQNQFLKCLRKYMRLVSEIPSVSIGPHSFRIGAVSALLRAGYPISVLESFAGWSTPSSTRYNRRATQDQIALSNVLDAATSMESVEITALLLKHNIPSAVLTPDNDEI